MNSQASPTIIGNIYDKYKTSNPIARIMMQRFLRAVSQLYLSTRPGRVLEVGCGEGHLSQHLIKLAHAPEVFQACDLSLVELASGLDERLSFCEADIYKLPFEDASFDLVICCEVLEHLEFPNQGLFEICRVSRRAVLISTPREPLWRCLNLLRGKYLNALGNTPGHVQHFSKSGLLRLLSPALDICEIRTPLPWTVILGHRRDGRSGSV
jgi:ubiquinone/menaquinone biosynthesis C-methylase UbiE